MAPTAARHSTLRIVDLLLFSQELKFWPNPEGFDPDRFLLEIPRGAFIPFAAGPRQCIGNHFALLESRLILSTIARQDRLNMVPGTRPALEPMITLRPRGGLPVTLEFL